jgi:hypothetical protein
MVKGKLESGRGEMKRTEKRATPFHFQTEDPELNRLLTPAATYRCPADVVNDPDLDLAEKRAILSSWASDACAVESHPSLRQPAGFSSPVTFDAIMSALQELDRNPSRTRSTREANGSQRTPNPSC